MNDQIPKILKVKALGQSEIREAISKSSICADISLNIEIES